MSLRIGDTCYPSKRAAAAVYRRLLWRYPIGATVTDPADAARLAELLVRHPEAEAKIGCGVAAFAVEQNLGSRGFWLTRLDGTRTDWSFLSCLTPPTHDTEVKQACRVAVRDQVRTFKTAAFAAQATIRCPFTGDVLTPATAHVDHDPPFDTLVTTFLAGCGLDLATIAVEPTTDGETDTILCDQQLACRWADYHRAHAGLRIVSRVANLSLLRRSGRT